MDRTRGAVKLALGLALVASGSVLVPAQAADPQQGTRFVGKTSQGYKISFRTSADGSEVRRLRVKLELTCRRNTLLSIRRARFRQTTRFIDIGDTGRFKGSAKIKGDDLYEIFGGRFKIRGRFRSSRRARGRLIERLHLREDIRCESGLIRFRVRAQ